MKPYYHDDSVTIYHGDAFEVLPTIARERVEADMLLADPPYGMNWQGTQRRTRPMFDVLQGDDGSVNFLEAIKLAIECLKNNAHIYCFGPLDLAPLPVTKPVALIWDKGLMGPGNLNIPWGPAHEPISFCVYNESKTNLDRGAGRLSARSRRGSVIHVQRLNSGQVVNHPTEKPVLLLRQLIEASSIIGDVILDPFCGSGAALDAAKSEGRRAIGIELEERYCEVAAARCQRILSFPDLSTLARRSTSESDGAARDLEQEGQ